MDAGRRNRELLQQRLQIALLELLVVLASCAVLYIVFAILSKFYGTILLFVIGAIVAFLLTPLINRLHEIVRKRWAAVALVYLGLLAGFVLLVYLLSNPFISQARSLGVNLQKPPQSALNHIQRVRNGALSLEARLLAQQRTVKGGNSLAGSDVNGAKRAIASLRAMVNSLENRGKQEVHGKTLSSGLPTAAEQITVPPSYIRSISAPLDGLASAYARAIGDPASVDRTRLDNAVTDGQQVSAAATDIVQKLATSSVLQIGLQSWLDRRGISLDLHQRFGDASKQLSAQTGSIFSNAATIVTTAGTLLLNAFLALLISIYFVADGPRIVRRLTQIGPPKYRARAPFYLQSLNRVMGGYIRAQILLAGLAGLLGAAGAWVLGVPYAVLIGLSTFFLALIPVIGPVVLILPPVLIAAIFTPVSTTVILLVYYLVVMQVVTNIIGPRVNSSSVGIHPLEAMAAALVGYPIAGILGSFFAVPILGFLHIAVKHAYQDFRHPPDVGTDAGPTDETNPPTSVPLAGTGS